MKNIIRLCYCLYRPTVLQPLFRSGPVMGKCRFSFRIFGFTFCASNVVQSVSMFLVQVCLESYFRLCVDFVYSKIHVYGVLQFTLQHQIIIPPPQNPTTKCGGGYTGFALSRRSVGRSVGPSVGRSVSNSCPLYNSFTNGRISFKLE